MKQQKFLFVDIISSLALLVILIGNFIGLLYIMNGELLYSMLGSMFLVVCYYFVVQQLKKNKEVMVKNNFLHLSSVFWIGFLFLAVLSFIFMSHFINVEYNCKEQIVAEANQKIKLLDSISEVYKIRADDDIQNYEAQLEGILSKYKATKNNALRNKLELEPFLIESSVLNSPDFINVNDLSDAKIKPYRVRINYNKKDIDSTLTLNNKNYLSVFDNWKRLSVVATYNKLNEYVTANLKSTNSKIAELPLNKTEIKIIFNKNQLPLNSPSALSVIYTPNYLIPILFIILTHLFILIPFFTWNIKTYKTLNIIDPLEIENVREI
jgi:hypothetical protein